MNTWNAEQAPDLAPVQFGAKLRGYVRIGLLVFVTLIGLCVFLFGRFLRQRVLGRRVTFHFGIAWIWARTCLWLAGLRLRVVGRPISAGVLMANHSSWLDILALRAVRLMYFVSKAEVADWPGVGFITRVTGTIFIERRRSQAKAQEAMLRDRIAHDNLLTIFPEGTSTDGLRVLEFKSSIFSAFMTHEQTIWVQPVTVRYHPAEGSGLPSSFYGWWGDMGFEAHIWEVVCRSQGGRVDVIFHKPVSTDDFADRKALAEHCRRKVAGGMETGQVIEHA